MDKSKAINKSSTRLVKARIGALCMMLLTVLLLSACSSNQGSVFDSGTAETSDSVARVPWDYRVVESTVGDLIGSDMTVLPDNELLPNDENYATGDKIWTLQFMDAELITDADQRNEVRLSYGRPLNRIPMKKQQSRILPTLRYR